ncbi:MAG: 50S ribosomal protein L24 [Deltaproteobacteria bacterium]|nr:50S ribosomal protein L24 [Deltaproteobacteria bacterium]
MKICKGDMVVIIAGKEKGKSGKVLEVNRERQRVLIEKLNMVKRHQRPNQQNRQGGIVEKEALLHISNVMLADPKTGKPTRVGVSVLKDGTKQRVAKRSGEIIAVNR